MSEKHRTLDIKSITFLKGGVVRFPVRTCIGCGKTEVKPGLIRLVQTELGRLEVDKRMQAQCRGAYIHPQESCIVALQCKRRGPRALARALRRRRGDGGTREKGLGELGWVAELVQLLRNQVGS